MPHHIRCVVEETWLTESRQLPTWLAAERLAGQLSPSNMHLFKMLRKKRLASSDEVKAWLDAFFKIRDYVPPKPPVDLSKFYNPSGILDTSSLAKTLGVDASEAMVRLKMLDKALMVAVVEEILQSVKHSHEHQHVIEFVRSRA
ncbi:MAG: hypothetical protein QW756_00100 [Nitrososphaerota archaeon]